MSSASAYQGKEIKKNKAAAPLPMTPNSTSFTARESARRRRAGPCGSMHNVVEKSGAWYSYSRERIGQGRENVRNFLKENKDIFSLTMQRAVKKLGIAGRQQRARSSRGPAERGSLWLPRR